MKRNFRKVPIQSLRGNFYSYGNPFLISGFGLHWFCQVLITTKPSEHRNRVK